MQQRMNTAAGLRRSISRHPGRGERIDIGGRSLRFVRAGPQASDLPIILCEHGAFGCAADWAEVQEQLALKDLRSLAYDRAGLGYSDPGPRPRDGRSVVADLEALLGAANEPGPYVLLAHSMGGLFARIFAARHVGKVAGVVLVDAVTPEVTDARPFALGVDAYRAAMRVVGWSARAGYMRPVSLLIGDLIGLSAEASAEKRRIYGSSAHTHWSAEEVWRWPAAALQAREAGALSPEIPVAVVTAGAEPASPRLKAVQTAPAMASRHGYVEHVAGSSHASLLGRRFAHRVVAGVQHVLDVTR